MKMLYHATTQYDRMFPINQTKTTYLCWLHQELDMMVQALYWLVHVHLSQTSGTASLLVLPDHVCPQIITFDLLFL